MPIIRKTIAALLVTLPLLANAQPFFFEFSGDFDSVGPDWPGDSTFTMFVTVDNGGDNPVDSFNVSHIQRTELVSGTYTQIWDRNLGGRDLSQAGFWEITFDGTNAVLSMADLDRIKEAFLQLLDATDNQGGNISASIEGSVGSLNQNTSVTTSLMISNNFRAYWNQTPNIFLGSRVRFLDVRLGHWAFTFIESLAQAGISVGCGNDNFCPDDTVTRAQMAVFLERSIQGSSFNPPPASGTLFTDVGANDFAAGFIEQLFMDGITAGCGSNNYCPNDIVTRAQMAILLLRAEHGAGYSPPPPVDVFADVDLSHWAAAWIEQLAAEGITVGCGGGNYCPENPATRAQMAVFLVRTFGL